MTTENVFISTGAISAEESLLMGILDKLLGTTSRKPKRVITDPVALARIEQTQSELASRLDLLDERVKGEVITRIDGLDERVQKVESALPIKENDKDA